MLPLGNPMRIFNICFIIGWAGNRGGDPGTAGGASRASWAVRQSASDRASVSIDKSVASAGEGDPGRSHATLPAPFPFVNEQQQRPDGLMISAPERPVSRQKAVSYHAPSSLTASRSEEKSRRRKRS
jgi:hypothetical protein